MEAIGTEKNNSITCITTVNGIDYINNPDPTGRRVGLAPLENIAETIRKTLENAKILVSKEYATRVIDEQALIEAINEIRGAITIAYPMGLPEWEPINDILNDTEDLTGTAASKEVLDVKSTCLWWASKELLTSKKLMDYIGKNEKTKVVVKIQKVVNI
jgi:hypothetical protein